MQSNNLPSSHLILGKSVLSVKERTFLLDTVATILNRDKEGRHNLCIHFAVLMSLLINYHFNIESSIKIGYVTYSNKKYTHHWLVHAWVETKNNELIDGNVDSMHLNDDVHPSIKPKSFWGDVSELPKDRKIINYRNFNANDLHEDDLEFIEITFLEHRNKFE